MKDETPRVFGIPGYGDISANTSAEMVLCFFAEIMGVLTFGTLSGMLSRMAFATKGANLEYENQMDYIRSYLEATQEAKYKGGLVF